MKPKAVPFSRSHGEFIAFSPRKNTACGWLADRSPAGLSHDTPGFDELSYRWDVHPTFLSRVNQLMDNDALMEFLVIFYGDPQDTTDGFTHGFMVNRFAKERVYHMAYRLRLPARHRDTPVIIHFNRILSIINHPAIGYPHGHGNPHLSINFSLKPLFLGDHNHQHHHYH